MLLNTEPLTVNPVAASQEPDIDCARALRAIGQDLTDLFPRVLEVRRDGSNFEVRGESHPNPFQRVKESTLKRTWMRLFGKETEPVAAKAPVANFTRTYTPQDLERLDQLHSANRTGQLKRPDNYSLAERLRTMGGIVNARKGRFKQLRKNADQLFVDYWDQSGQVQTAKLTTIIMYRNQQPDRPHPSTHTLKEAWEGYDF